MHDISVQQSGKVTVAIPLPSQKAGPRFIWLLVQGHTAGIQQSQGEGKARSHQLQAHTFSQELDYTHVRKTRITDASPRLHGNKASFCKGLWGIAWVKKDTWPEHT